jgi:hypothetical protein
MFCIAQALVSQHRDLVKRINATYKQFPRSNRSRPRVFSVNQLVSIFDLHIHCNTPYSGAGTLQAMDPTDPSFQIKHVDKLDPSMTYDRIGNSLVFFQHRSWFPSSHENPNINFSLDTASDHQFIFYQELDLPAHSVSLLWFDLGLLFFSGSTIATVGSAQVLTNYITLFKHDIAMRFDMVHIVDTE